MRYTALLGRIFFSAIFILSSFKHFDGSLVSFAAAAGTPAAALLVPLSGILALVGGVNILLGYKTRASAWLIVLFLVPVTLAMHRFWGLTDPQAAMQQQIHFMKNLCMLGGALMIAHFGAGPLSFDAGSKHAVMTKDHIAPARREEEIGRVPVGSGVVR